MTVLGQAMDLSIDHLRHSSMFDVNKIKSKLNVINFIVFKFQSIKQPWVSGEFEQNIIKSFNLV